jgi:hypothetical protein
MAQLLTLGGVTIKKPNDFQIERYNLTKSGRVATGEMMMDLVAKKLKFLVKYEIISGANMNAILAIIDSTTMFFTLTYLENDVEKSATVYVGAIKSTQFRTDSGAWYWKNFEFDLIQQ